MPGAAVCGRTADKDEQEADAAFGGLRGGRARRADGLMNGENGGVLQS